MPETSRAQRAFAILILAKAQRLLLDGYSLGLDPVLCAALFEVAEADYLSTPVESVGRQQ